MHDWKYRSNLPNVDLMRLKKNGRIFEGWLTVHLKSFSIGASVCFKTTTLASYESWMFRHIVLLQYCQNYLHNHFKRGHVMKHKSIWRCYHYGESIPNDVLIASSTDVLNMSSQHWRICFSKTDGSEKCFTVCSLSLQSTKPLISLCLYS